MLALRKAGASRQPATAARASAAAARGFARGARRQPRKRAPAPEAPNESLVDEFRAVMTRPPDQDQQQPAAPARGPGAPAGNGAAHAPTAAMPAATLAPETLQRLRACTRSVGSARAHVERLAALLAEAHGALGVLGAASEGDGGDGGGAAHPLERQLAFMLQEVLRDVGDEMGSVADALGVVGGDLEGVEGALVAAAATPQAPGQPVAAAAAAAPHAIQQRADPLPSAAGGTAAVAGALQSAVQQQAAASVAALTGLRSIAAGVAALDAPAGARAELAAQIRALAATVGGSL
ncbi:hypothetical protein Rsub_12897 [Raphidocelis subcapitata]|uniref:Uncharacterized protein n=1 Tax=Raphidocelis subcapitata TaxID=307507 RepID=A0A2V0PME0_9CHLO|nr:hypothetical protein Rsub_12897 [Raphidocelis subcapitata]|eukprot:GBG00253.1 hypothetical protein Rsub_12897 [Raphidocelis subcapitata]